MADTWDVIVCGGGTAGVAAAIAAGRRGAKTLIIERFGALGGTQTMGWVTPMMPNYIGQHKLSRGISLELTKNQLDFQPTPADVDHNDYWFDPVALPLIMDRMVKEAGVECLFDATLVSADKDGNTIKAVNVMTRAGLIKLEASAFIDCTGDAVLSMIAGAELMGGNEDGVHQPMTLRFAMGNIDLIRFRQAAKYILRCDTDHYLEAGYGEAKKGPMEPIIREAINKGILEEDDIGYFQFFTMNGKQNELAFNMPRVASLDPLDPFAISKGYQVGREKVFRIAAFMKANFEGCENAHVSSIAPLIGIRETRRVVGEYILTEEDHQTCRKFENTIARNRYPVDIHLKVGTDYRKSFEPHEYHDIPYESIVVKGLDNLWVAGRCLSATFVAQSAVRIQPVCRATGEAAGCAAAVASLTKLKAREVPYSQIVGYLDLALPGLSESA